MPENTSPASDVSSKEDASEKADVPSMNQTPVQNTKTGKTLAIIGIISGAVAFALFPPFFGILGIILGALAVKKGQRQLGWVAVGISIAGLIVGMILGFLFFSVSQTGE